MKKITLFTGLLGLYLFVACQQKSEVATNKAAVATEQEMPTTPAMAEEDGMAEEAMGEDAEEAMSEEAEGGESNANLDMADAIAAFDEGDFAVAADYLTIAVKSLKEETAGLNSVAKIAADKSITVLEQLATKVRAGEIKDAGVVKAAVAQMQKAMGQ